VQKIAVSGNYLVPDVFLMCRKLQYLEIIWSRMCQIWHSYFIKIILCLKLAVDIFLVHHLYFLTSYSQIKIQ